MDNIEISVDKSRLDIAVIIDFLHGDSYWAKNRPEDVIRRSIENSLCFGMYDDNGQIGFARAVTDRATFYYLADIFILPRYQYGGLGKRLMDYILTFPDLTGLRGVLTTQTAHDFYEKYGFSRNNDIVERRIMVRQP